MSFVNPCEDLPHFHRLIYGHNARNLGHQSLYIGDFILICTDNQLTSLSYMKLPGGDSMIINTALDPYNIIVVDSEHIPPDLGPVETKEQFQDYKQRIKNVDPVLDRLHEWIRAYGGIGKPNYSDEHVDSKDITRHLPPILLTGIQAEKRAFIELLEADPQALYPYINPTEVYKEQHNYKYVEMGPYSMYATCGYCGSKTPSDYSQVTTTLYCRTIYPDGKEGTFGVLLNVPRCRKCKHKHNLSYGSDFVSKKLDTIFGLWFVWLSITAGIATFACLDLEWFLKLLLAALVFYVCVRVLNNVQGKWLNILKCGTEYWYSQLLIRLGILKRRTFADEYESYAPIQELKAMGFDDVEIGADGEKQWRFIPFDQIQQGLNEIAVRHDLFVSKPLRDVDIKETT